MAKIIKLEINNFRGYVNLPLTFAIDQSFVCFVGRGDSGKSTILEAISVVLSPNWNLTFHDTDFYNCDTKNPIEIKASLIDFPENFLSEEKFGLYLRSLAPDSGEITDDFIDETDEALKPVLTIRLFIDESLEPKWTITNTRQQEDKPISGADRALLNCYMISDYLDRHFSWNKGNPLYALLRTIENQDVSSEKNVIIQSLRDAKKTIDKCKFEELKEVTDLIKAEAASFGLNILNAHTTLDVKELSIKDGRISLHEDAIPFRLKGKGSKRLASLAIQSALVSNGGIMLIDEVEQGLEPDRAKQLVRSLKQNQAGQIFLTTHSREVITELESQDLTLVIRDKDNSDVKVRRLSRAKEKLQAAVRACSEAFFAQKVIVCEGKTEIGICRALDKYRKTKGLPLMSFADCAYVLGEGSSLVSHTKEINEAEFKTALFCDSDNESTNNEKSNLRTANIDVFDCEDSKNIEGQVFNDLPWDGVRQLIDYVLTTHKKGNLDDLKTAVKSKYPDDKEFADNALEEDSSEIRIALAAASTTKDKEWFKRLDHGEAMGQIIFQYMDVMDNENHLKQMLLQLSNWIDG